MTKTKTVQDVATEMLKNFEQKERTDFRLFLWRNKKKNKRSVKLFYRALGNI